jgi:hypothetical protein
VTGAEDKGEDEAVVEAEPTTTGAVETDEELGITAGADQSPSGATSIPSA